ncbi:MAG: hypothetical protein K2O15_10250 [Lachnospiraceae bacterium]|nr:hypothetical protein [Lachnospiraceae bacterium]
MAYNFFYKMAYNGIDRENWIEGRDPLIQRGRRVRSTFLNINNLEKSGRDLQADLEDNGMKSVPRKFVKFENMNY